MLLFLLGLMLIVGYLEVGHLLRIRPQPYLIALAMGSNVGSVLSVTGNPQNMLVGIWSGLSFGESNSIVAERAQARGVRLGFGEYARAGVPVTLLTLAWGTTVLLLT